ncbi:MAG TPA: hypothetical protein VF671_03035 [Pseudomonas sp.]|jgi:hypothetical protein|uniref:hypothetical protein n=1 Tax=Pseudomonas sp. TaxID=306 RepID=UPI002EDA66B3
MEVTTTTITPFAPLSITSVVDSSGTSIPNLGTTQDTELTLSGTGPDGDVVSILDNGDVIGRPSVTVAGTWEISATVALGAHSFTARAADGTVSVPWVVTVVNAAVKPTIDSIVDSKGVPIPSGSNTSDTNVTLAGTAESGSTVEIKDGATPWGTALADGGTWTKTLAGLPLGLHSMTAVTGADVSDLWPFTVIVAVKPVITSVKGGNGVEISPGGYTASTTINLAGTARDNLSVEIFDGAVLKGSTTASDTGVWAIQITGLVVGAHNMTAKSDGLTSDLWSLTVVSPLSMSPAQMNLSGLSLKVNWPRTGQDSLDNTQTRTASGGMPPYTYTSSAPTIASVTQAGKVTGEFNGSAIITVRDGLNASVSYPVAVSNVWQMGTIDSALTHNEFVAWLGNTPSAIGIGWFRDDMIRVYSRPFPIVAGGIYWTGTRVCEGCSGQCTEFMTAHVFDCGLHTNRYHCMYAVATYGVLSMNDADHAQAFPKLPLDPRPTMGGEIAIRAEPPLLPVKKISSGGI